MLSLCLRSTIWGSMELIRVRKVYVYVIWECRTTAENGGLGSLKAKILWDLHGQLRRSRVSCEMRRSQSNLEDYKKYARSLHAIQAPVDRNPHHHFKYPNSTLQYEALFYNPDVCYATCSDRSCSTSHCDQCSNPRQERYSAPQWQWSNVELSLIKSAVIPEHG